MYSKSKEILHKLQEYSSITREVIWRDLGWQDYKITDELIDELLVGKYIKVTKDRLVSAHDILTLDSRGLEFLEEEEQKRKQDAEEAAAQEAEKIEFLEKERREFRHDWKIAIFSALAGSLLSRPLWSGIDWMIAWLSK